MSISVKLGVVVITLGLTHYEPPLPHPILKNFWLRPCEWMTVWCLRYHLNSHGFFGTLNLCQELIFHSLYCLLAYSWILLSLGKKTLNQFGREKFLWCEQSLHIAASAGYSHLSFHSYGINVCMSKVLKLLEGPHLFFVTSHQHQNERSIK